MMNKRQFETLIVKARDDSPPAVDVAGRVIATLAAERFAPGRTPDRALMWMAAFSSAAAVPTVVMAICVYHSWVGPLFEISRAIAWVTQ